MANKKDLEKKVHEFLELAQRLKADFDNYRKKEQERISDYEFRKTKEMILKILPWFDNLELALKHAPENLDGSEWIVGIKNIILQAKKLFNDSGLEEIKTENQVFDPVFHEAVAFEEVKAGNSDADGDSKIIEEIQKGYTLAGKVIRPAKVKLG